MEDVYKYRGSAFFRWSFLSVLCFSPSYSSSRTLSIFLACSWSSRFLPSAAWSSFSRYPIQSRLLTLDLLLQLLQCNVENHVDFFCSACFSVLLELIVYRFHWAVPSVCFGFDLAIVERVEFWGECSEDLELLLGEAVYELLQRVPLDVVLGPVRHSHSLHIHEFQFILVC